MAFLLNQGFSKSTAEPRLFFLARISDRRQGKQDSSFIVFSIFHTSVHTLLFNWIYALAVIKKWNVNIIKYALRCSRICLWLKEQVLFFSVWNKMNIFRNFWNNFLKEIESSFFRCLVDFVIKVASMLSVYAHAGEPWQSVQTGSAKANQEVRSGGWRDRQVYCNSLTRRKITTTPHG